MKTVSSTAVEELAVVVVVVAAAVVIVVIVIEVVVVIVVVVVVIAVVVHHALSPVSRRLDAHKHRSPSNPNQNRVCFTFSIKSRVLITAAPSLTLLTQYLKLNYCYYYYYYKTPPYTLNAILTHASH